MKYTIITTVAVAALMCAAATHAQTKSEDVSGIVVVGQATASKRADFGRLKFDLRGEGASRVEALRLLAEHRKQVERGLAGLVDVKAVAVDPAPIKFEEVRGAECHDEGSRLSKGACAVTGYIAEMSEEVRITPAERTGDAASLVAQLGANSVSITGGGLNDLSSLQSEAVAKALAEARSEAQAIAAAEGVRLGRLMRVDPRSAIDLRLDGMVNVEALLNTLPAVTPEQSPQVRFDRTVADVEMTATYTVTYAIER